ncbi:MAG: hypothetical protein EVJ46_06170 [Candidatus Acididesulfobacter guangdongensis]|uniref:Uncharacterized protein n=1 Tax=Acididesulfobacter guangdongensis TaxID=2597225 RepID=A0A519BH51_ACIG2|nr:MAG: hypothetical protein EVJ46_06170 [Candidatus Acididesulfobacter guangdongensis]
MNNIEILKRNYAINRVDNKKIAKWKCKECSNLIKNFITNTPDEYSELFKYGCCKIAVKEYQTSEGTHTAYHQLYELKRCPLILPKPKKVKKIEMSHSECIDKVAKWLQKQHESISLYRCKVILKEPHGYNISREYPDVLGTGMKNDINIECKVSRQDFLKDGKKQHNHPFGNFKFYACPEGLILPDEIPEEFGLIYIGKESCRMIKKPLYVKECENTAPMLADLFLNRNNKVWDGKAVIL